MHMLAVQSIHFKGVQFDKTMLSNTSVFAVDMTCTTHRWLTLNLLPELYHIKHATSSTHKYVQSINAVTFGKNNLFCDCCLRRVTTA